MLHILPTLTECEILILQTLWNLPHSCTTQILRSVHNCQVEIERDLCLNIEKSAWS